MTKKISAKTKRSATAIVGKPRNILDSTKIGHSSLMPLEIKQRQITRKKLNEIHEFYSKNWRKYFRVEPISNAAIHELMAEELNKVKGSELEKKNWSAEYIRQIWVGKLPTSRFIMRAIALLHAKLKKQTRSGDKLRVYIPVRSEAERKMINRVPANKRRVALLALAHHQKKIKKYKSKHRVRRVAA